MVSLLRGAMLAVTLACWLISLYKLRDLTRDPHNRPLRALCLAVVTITLSLTLQPLMPAVDRFFGVLDLARLVSNSLSLACVTAAQAFLLYLSTDLSARRRVRHRWLAFGATVVVMILLFVLTPPATDLSDPRVGSGEYYGDPFTGPFLYPYLAYLGWSLLQVAVLARRYAAIAPRPITRFGLRLITAGSLVGMAYVAAKLAAVAAGALWDRAELAADAVVVFCFTTSVLLVLIGSTIPSWGPRVGLDRLWFWAVAVRDCHRLYPLWQAIHTVLPEIALLPTGHGIRRATTFAREASLRRVRLTVEILDGYALLRPWMSGAAYAQARQAACATGLTGDQLAAITEAAVVNAALNARQQDLPPASDADDVPALPGGGRGDAPGDDIAADQVLWLTKVARAYRSPRLSTITAQLSQPYAAPTTPTPGR